MLNPVKHLVNVEQLILPLLKCSTAFSTGVLGLITYKRFFYVVYHIFN